MPKLVINLGLHFVFAFSFFQSISQSVSNVRAFEEDGTVMIVYDLFTTKPEKEFYVSLYSSKDEGKVFSIVYDVKGDANKNVRIGTEHTIQLKPTGEIKGLVFKVEAGPKKIPDIRNGKFLIEHNSGKIEIIKTERKNTSVELTFALTNNREKGDSFIIANFFIVDDADKIYRNGRITVNEREGNVLNAENGSTLKFKLTLNDVPETSNGFKKIEFNISEIFAQFSNVKIGLWQY